jgi:hypothetical protein
MDYLEYTDSSVKISHTFYFVVQPTKADNTISRITDGDKFNIHMTGAGAGFFPINRTIVDRTWELDIDYSSAQFTNMISSDYIVILLKVKYNSSLNYDYRISFTGKSGSSIYGIDGGELLSRSATFEVGNTFSLTTTDFGGARLYEFGVINEYVSNENFDKIKTSLLDKYYQSGNI